MDVNKIIARAKSMLLTPRTEWPVVAAEPDTVGGIYSNYVFVLAAIPALAGFVRTALIGVSVPFLGAFRVGIGAGLTTAVLGYVLGLIGVYVVALIVDALAPTFGAEKNRVQAFKVVAYAYTASWVASIIGLVPGLTLLAALAGGIYSIYLLNMGLPFTMKCPPEKAVGYTVVTIIAAIVIAVILNLVVGSVAGLGMGMMGRGLGGLGGMTAPSMAPGITPGGSGGFDSNSPGGKLQAWANKMQEASKQAEAASKSGDKDAQAKAVGAIVGAALGGGAKVESLAPDRIKPFLPNSLGGLQRTQMSVERTAAMGVQISKGTASYSDGGERNVTITITDTGSLKGLVGFAAGWAGVEQESETDSGYDKTYKSGGQLVHEKWDNRSHSGEYGVVVGDRFSVSASGNATGIDDLKSAVAGINLSGLDALKGEGVQAN